MAKGIALALMCALANPLSAQADDPPLTETMFIQSPIELRAEEVVLLLNGDSLPQYLFTPDFLRAVPVSQIEKLGSDLTGQFGQALVVESLTPREGNRARIAIRLERAVVRGWIAVDPSRGYRISELVLRAFDPLDDSVEQIEADLAALPGEVSAYFGPVSGAPAGITIRPEAQMPVASTMKLYVLAALGREIAQGRRAWSDVVTLGTPSFPSGQMHDWPGGAPVTLHTLASMMISISDNTATDRLIELLGRDTILALARRSGHAAPVRNTPWMTTRDMFLLKGGNQARLEAYRRAPPDVRAQILAGIEEEPVSAEAIERAFASGPIAIDVEWFASTADLARLFRLMRAECDSEVFAIMAISPAMPPEVAAKWQYIGYKGGSEPGVLNLTWLLRDASGRDRMLSLSWANPAESLDKARLELIAQRILSLPQ